MPKIQTRFKNGLQSSHVARQIAQDQHRGSQTENLIETVLNQLREATSVRSLKQIDQDTIRAYIDTLKDKFNAGELSNATTSTYISALNDVIRYVDEHLNKTLETVSAQEYGLSRGKFKFHHDTVPQDFYDRYKEFLSSKDDIRAQALSHSIELQRELGLRLRESVRIKQEAIISALKTNILHIDKNDGTKGGQARDIPVKYDSQREALQSALSFMQRNNMSALIPNGKIQKQQLYYAQNIRRAFNRINNIEKMDNHGNRKHFLSNEAKKYGLKYATEEAGHHRKDAMSRILKIILELFLGKKIYKKLITYTFNIFCSPLCRNFKECHYRKLRKKQL